MRNDKEIYPEKETPGAALLPFRVKESVPHFARQSDCFINQITPDRLFSPWKLVETAAGVIH